MRRLGLALAALLTVPLVSACTGSTQPIVKLGLIAPFEEAHRADGYAALWAVKLAVNERNAAGGAGGRQVALVALNDNSRPEEAAMQAAKLGIDRAVLGVIGPLTDSTAAAAGPVLEDAGLAWLDVAGAPKTETQPAAEFVAAYRGLAGIDPTLDAVEAYEATTRLLDAIDRAGRSGPPTRSAVLRALANQGPDS